MNHWKQAIKYVHNNRTWSDAREKLAWEIMDEQRCPITHADPSIADDICDLMEEYGQDYDLPEGWWYDYGTEDDVFFAIGY